MAPRTKKILIALAAVLVLLTAGCIVCAVSGASSFNGWMGHMREQGQQVMGEADQFAAGHDQNACLDEGRRRDVACGVATEITCHAQAGVYLGRCLDRATPVEGFCDGVPPQTEIMQGAQWALDRCVGQPGDPQSCRTLMQSVQRHCDAARPTTP